MTSVMRMVVMMSVARSFALGIVPTYLTAVVNVMCKQRLLNGRAGLLHVWLLDHLWLLLEWIVTWLLHFHWLCLGIIETSVSLYRYASLDFFIGSERLSKF